MASESLTLYPPDSDELTLAAKSQYEFANSIVIVSASDYDLAGEELRGIRQRVKKLEAQRIELTSPLDVVKKRIMDLFRGPIEILTGAGGAIEEKMSGYRAEQKRIADKAHEEAEALARKQREEAEAIARKARDEADRLAQEARHAKDADARAAAQARAQEAQEAAAAAEMAKTIITPVVIAPPPVASSGVSVATSFKAEVFDLFALIKFVSAHPEYQNLLEANQTALNALARAQKQHFQIDGVRAVVVETLRSK